MALFDSGNGTTPCPKCGEPMGMVTWIGPKPVCHRCRNTKTPGVWQSLLGESSDPDDHPCAHEQLEKSLPPNQRGGAHGLVCNCPKCRIIC